MPALALPAGGLRAPALRQARATTHGRLAAPLAQPALLGGRWACIRSSDAARRQRRAAVQVAAAAGADGSSSSGKPRKSGKAKRQRSAGAAQPAAADEDQQQQQAQQPSARAQQQQRDKEQQQQQQQQEQQTAAAPAAARQQQQQYLYEPKHGLPVVRRKLGYGELLRVVRLGEVTEVHFFTTDPEQTSVEGPCLVVMQDGTVAQAYIPEGDWRMRYAMETHGVTAVRMAPAPTDAELRPRSSIFSNEAGAFIVKWIPYVLVALVYAATSYVRWKKGDAEDRIKLQRKKEEDVKKRAAEEKQERVLEEAEALARLGYSTDMIVDKYTKAGFEVDAEAVAEVMARVQAEAAAAGDGRIFNKGAAQQEEALNEWRRKMDEEMAGDDPQAQAEQMLKMRTAKIKKARDPDKARRQKEAQKSLKNIKLMVSDKDEDVFFDDVAGIGDAKVELTEVVDFFRKPELFRASGARTPRGVLLCGPPGTGKTLLARAVAGEAGATFIALNASEFVEMFVGVGASRVRDLFAQARAQAPAIIFIDEIDSVGRIRGGAKGNDERDQTLNQMLSEMDGFDPKAQVVVMAATNRRDILDPALVRPGRFDRIVYVPLPDYNGRIEIVNVHLAKRAHSDDIDFHELSFETNGYSGAQLANLVNMAATCASQRGSEEIHNQDFEKALEFERLGPERPRYSDDARRRIAAMEAATALACTLLPAIEPVLQVTIVPREKHPLGQTVVKPSEQRELTGLYTRRYLEQQLLTLLAGRAAEELLYGPDGMSTMQQRRLVDARRVVQKLVVSGAMTENAAVGPRTISVPRRMGATLMQAVPNYVPPELHAEADAEMERLLEQAYFDAKALLQRNRPALDALVEALVARDTLQGDEVREVVDRLADAGDLQQRREQLERLAFL